MKEDELKIKDEYEVKLEELKQEYIDKMKEISDKFDEKHKDLQTKRMDIEHQYERALAEFHEQHGEVPAHHPYESEDWQTSPDDYYGDYKEDATYRASKRGHKDMFDQF